MSPRPLVRVVRPGPLTTVQDAGRFGYQHLGVPAAGAMDPLAYRVAVALAGGPAGAAALEITLGGFEALFLAETAAALAGADLGFELDGRPVGPGEAFRARPGARIRATGRRWGCRAYLAVWGGFAVPPVLGSRSTYLPARLGGVGGRALRAGDELPGTGGVPPGWEEGRRVPPGLVPAPPGPGEPVVLRAVPGPQDDAFTRAGRETFFSALFTVSPQADRMGYRLDGPRIEHSGPADIISDGVAWGAVQVPAHGRPIVLLGDRQTVGGYPKIATVIRADLPRIAQAIPGDPVRFAEVDLWEAREIFGLTEIRLRGWEARAAGRLGSWAARAAGRPGGKS